MCGWRNDAGGAARAFRHVRSALFHTNAMRRALLRMLPRNPPTWVPLAPMRGAPP